VKLGNKNFRTKGGVTTHAEKRLFQQYGCCLSAKKARKILREIIKDEYDGHIWVPETVQKSLRVALPYGNRLVLIVASGEIVTVEDKPFIEEEVICQKVLGTIYFTKKRNQFIKEARIHRK